MLIVIVKFRTKTGLRDDMINLAKAAITPSRNEEGCILYEFLEDPYDLGSFTFYEKWRSREDLELHFEEPHFKEFAQHSPELIEGERTFETFEVVSEN